MSSPRPADRDAQVAEVRAADLLRDLLCRWAGLALPDHRWPLLRATLERLAPDGTIEAALERLAAGDRVAKQAVLSGVTVPETYLFRHPDHFEVLAEHALAAAAGRVTPYRVLSAGCATGEEAWSAAAVLDRVGRSTGLRWEVIGWDLDADRIARARAGHYSAWSARNGLSGYEGAFERRGQGWRVHPRLRPWVRFECVNLKAGPLPASGAFDAIFLRNVAIYWAPECAAEMIVRLANLVSPGGLLLMGAAEPETLSRAEWTVGWRGSVLVATRGAALAQREVGEPTPTASRPARHRATVIRAARARVAISCQEPRGAAAADEADPLVRVTELADQGRYFEALAILDDLPPTPNADLYLWRGILCLNLSRPDDALACVRKAVFLAPFDAACRHWLAVALSACGRHEAAAREHRNIRELCK